jgi:hypothetical protein
MAYRSNESVSATGHRLDKARPVGRIAQCIPQPTDRSIEAVVKIDKGIRRPQFAPQLLASDYFARVLQQSDQNLKGLFLQSDLRSVSAQFTCSQVQFEHTEPSRRITVNRNQRLTP